MKIAKSKSAQQVPQAQTIEEARKLYNVKPRPNIGKKIVIMMATIMLVNLTKVISTMIAGPLKQRR